jgi:hypothetical protein
MQQAITGHGFRRGIRSAGTTRLKNAHVCFPPCPAWRLRSP